MTKKKLERTLHWISLIALIGSLAVQFFVWVSWLPDIVLSTPITTIMAGMIGFFIAGFFIYVLPIRAVYKQIRRLK